MLLPLLPLMLLSLCPPSTARVLFRVLSLMLPLPPILLTHLIPPMPPPMLSRMLLQDPCHQRTAEVLS
jgi:hypothetical protein